MYGQAGGGSGDLNLRFSPLNLANQQHELGHKTDDESRRQIDEVHRWEAEQLARLIDSLRDSKMGLRLLTQASRPPWTRGRGSRRWAI